MRELTLLLLILSVAVGCDREEEQPQADPLQPFFRQEVGPPCEKNADCATGLCDRLLLPGNGEDEAQGACSSVPFAIFAWQRALLAGNIAAVVAEDEALRARVLSFASAALAAPDAPLRLRMLSLELAQLLLGDEVGVEWRALLATMTGAWSLPTERLLAGVILASRGAEADAFESLSSAATRGPEGHRIRAARELAGLCLQASAPVLGDLATDRDSRFIRDAVVEVVANCPEPLRSEVLDAAIAEAMPYERSRFLRLGLGLGAGADSAGESTPAD